MAIKKAQVTMKDATTLVWTFGNGNSHEVNVDTFSKDVQDKAKVHGFKQKLSDCYSGAGSASEAEQAFKAQLEGLKGDAWNAGRSSTGGIWVEALAKAAGVSVEEAQAKWEEMTEEKKKELKAHAGIKLAKLEIEKDRAERKAKDAEPLEF